MSLIVMDEHFVKLGEISQYTSLSMKRSYYGTGAFQVTCDPRAKNAMGLMPGCVVFLSARPQEAYLIEDITLTVDKLTASGCMLKGLAKRRVCVPPTQLPAELSRYTGGAWVVVTDRAEIKAALECKDVLQGFAAPKTAEEGTYFLNVTQLGTVYQWGVSLDAGNVLSNLEAAKVRSKYQNFGWDRFTGTAEAAYLHFARNNMIAPEDGLRAIPHMVATLDKGRGAVLPWQARFEKLTEVFDRIGEATEIGWDIVPNMETRKFEFGAFAGRDLTQGIHTILIAECMGNATAISLKRTLSSSASTVYAGGAGEDENRLILSVGGERAGLGRREAWSEAGSVDDVEMLKLFAKNKLDGLCEKRTLTATLLATGACRPKRDYDVGDKVLVQDAYGTRMGARITEMTEVHEGGTCKYSAVFGDAPITLGRVLERMSGATN